MVWSSSQSLQGTEAQRLGRAVHQVDHVNCPNPLGWRSAHATLVGAQMAVPCLRLGFIIELRLTV
eukprot:2995223-Amphidinium_carterae.1